MSSPEVPVVPAPLHQDRPPLPCETRVDGEDLVLTFTGPPDLYRVDLRTKDGTFDVDSLYIRCTFRPFREGNTPDDPDAPLTGPWDYINDGFVVPVADVYLDGDYLHQTWIDLPGIASLERGGVETSFAFWTREAGEHEVRVKFDAEDGRLRAEDFEPAVLRQDERKPIQRVGLREKLKGRHPRLFFAEDNLPRLRREKDSTHKKIWQGIQNQIERVEEKLDESPHFSSAEPLDRRAFLARAYAFLNAVEPRKERADRALASALAICEAETWGPTMTKGHMNCDNDMHAGQFLYVLCCVYDWLYGHVDPDKLDILRDKIVHHARLLYEFAVFQRDYWPTGYIQNHCTASLHGLGAAGLLFLGEEPDAQAWADWTRRSFDGTLELFSLDGAGLSLEYTFGLCFTLRYTELLLYATNENLYAQGCFHRVFEHYQYLVSPHAYSNHVILANRTGNPRQQAMVERYIEKVDHHSPGTFLSYRPFPGRDPYDLPLCKHFDDCGWVVMQDRWDRKKRVKMLFHCGPIFGHSVFEKARRYNFAHGLPGMAGILVEYKGLRLICGSQGSYRKETRQLNCVTVDGQGQWGDGFVWMPKLAPDQVPHIPFYEDTHDYTIVRGDATQAYPPKLGLDKYFRTIAFCKPDLFLVHDHLESETAGTYEWRLHTNGDWTSLGDGIYCVEQRGVRFFVRDLLHADRDAQTGVCEIVPAYRFNGHYARELCLTVEADHPRTDLLFALSADQDMLRALAVKERDGTVCLQTERHGQVTLHLATDRITYIPAAEDV